MTPDMELYLHYWNIISVRGWRVYDHLPAEGEKVSYPFVVIGEIDNTTAGTKSSLNGTVTLTIDVWGKLEDRKAVSTIANGILLSSIGRFRTKSYAFTGFKDAQQVQLMTDTSVANTVFIRGMVSIELQIQ